MFLDSDEVADLALQLHLGQRDLQGRDYFAHHLAPIAATLAPLGEAYEQAGYFYDAIEDTGVTALELLQAGVGLDVVTAVVAVTRRTGSHFPNGKEPC